LSWDTQGPIKCGKYCSERNSSARAIRSPSPLDLAPFDHLSEDLDAPFLALYTLLKKILGAFKEIF
jgi:hypothetical protein